MDNESVLISHDDGMDPDSIEGLRLALSDMRTFLAKVDELGLAETKHNLVMVNMLKFSKPENILAELDYDPGSFFGPALAAFDRDLVSLHLRDSRQFDEAEQYEAVWKTTASMERFRRILDLAWKLYEEYGLPGNHRALDQRH